ncbi:MAG: D-glycero-beta-D-manno-heptose 1,7-bisphosphate 7-phosphatase [Ectothiorhodospira sp.]
MTGEGARLVILDRDGVINRDSPDYIKSPQEWIPLPGSLEAIARLTRAGWRVAVATNQSGLARGLFDAATLEAIHDRMRRAVEAAGGRIDCIHHCPHGPDDGCDCRKPRPGLLHRIADDLGVSLAGVPAVGDSARDLEAARAAGCRPLLVRTGNGARTLARGGLPPETQVFPDLAAVVEHLLAEETGRGD